MRIKQRPVIRFPKFEEGWKKGLLSELMEFSNGINAPKENYGKGRKMISVLDILEDGPIIYDKIRNSVEVDDTTESKNKVVNGDLVFVRSSEVRNEVGWTKAYLQEEYALYSGFSIRGKKIRDFDAKFVELSLNYCNRDQIERKAGGSTRYNVGQSILKNIEVLKPSIEEQNDIGNFFKIIDETISLHQQELTTLKQTKQGFLQKMFPKEGESVPDVRFPGFNAPWKQYKLGEMSVSFEYGLNASATKYDGKNKYIRITDIDENTHKFLKDNLTSPNIDLSSAENYLLKEGDILFARTGASVGKSYIYDKKDGKVYYAGFLIRARIKSEYDSRFIFQNTLTSKYREFIKVTSQRSGQPGVNAQEYANYSVIAPNKEEQIKIGNFFKQLDDILDFHQSELDALKETKKAFLQKMFV
ncbi:restriction endonuclease subunit S [Sutcliffiella sp. NPDC057660]|uniref:restriction endonuclease subunit S n=1 Tax=Sutcliffiella sp. NPDC057660 TaxID=3346199 RepID=UPI003675A2D9